MKEAFDNDSNIQACRYQHLQRLTKKLRVHGYTINGNGGGRCTINTDKLKARAGQDSILKLEVATMPNQAYEVVVVLKVVETEPLDELSWPVSFFGRTYGSFADDPIELSDDLRLWERSPMYHPPDYIDNITDARRGQAVLQYNRPADGPRYERGNL